jgi:hypothetical protein
MNVHVNRACNCLYFNTQFLKPITIRFNIKKFFFLPTKCVPVLSMGQAAIVLLYSIMLGFLERRRRVFTAWYELDLYI